MLSIFIANDQHMSSMFSTFSKGSFTNYVYSNGGRGVHEMSTLQNNFEIFFQIKLSTRGERGSKKAKNQFVNDP